MPLQDPETKCVMLLSTLQAKMVKHIDNQLGVHGISYSEYMAMYHLNHAAEKTMRRIELAEKLNMSASGVTRLLAPMEKIKLVERARNPRDARVSLVKLSQTGEEIFRDAAVTFEQSAKALMGPLGANEVEVLLGLAEALA